MEKRYNYVVDTVSTDEYYSAINKINKATWWVPTEPFAQVDFEIGVLGLMPELRKIILTAGKFTGAKEHTEKHYYIQSSGTPRVLLEPLRGANSSQWIRLCIDRNPTGSQKKKNKTDIYIPDINDDSDDDDGGFLDRFLRNIQMFELIDEDKQRFFPAREIETEEGQLNAKKFIALWQEGLRYLLGVIREPVDFSKLPARAAGENKIF